MALGEVGLDVDYFYGLSPREFSNILTGYRNKERRAYITSWEQTRQLMYITLTPHLKRNKQGKVIKPLKLTDVIKFDWDDGSKKAADVPKVTQEDALAFWAKVDNKQKKEDE